MIVQVHAQLPFANRGQSISPLIVRIARESRWSEITGIFAYSTVSGMLELLTPIESLTPKPSFRWLFGTDDCLTEPGALELAQTPGHHLRVASLLGSRRRFHPKVLHFESNDDRGDVAIVGSANLTLNGLTANAEAITILRAVSPSDVTVLRNMLSRIYKLGHAPTPQELTDYRKAYKAARPHHRKVASLSPKLSPRSGRGARRKTARPVSSPGLDPTVATRCWIEVGKNTAQGRELEIKAAQAMFFDLHHSRGARQARHFLLSNGTSIPMNFKYQSSNAMWRLQMRNEVPEVRQGLRPLVRGRLGRSPYVAVFERIDSRRTFALRFIRDSSQAYSRLIHQAESDGVIGNTTTRQYGWS